MDPHGQRAVLDFLATPAAFAAAASEPVERIDTHISAVFLCGERVFKLKKAVRMPFLDFTGLEARRRACHDEVALNRRTAPDLYLGVSSINRGADGALRVDGDGPAVDWLVVMRRFPQDDLFDRMLAAGRLDRGLMAELAEVVAGFHRDAERTPHLGGRRNMAWTIANNAECMARHPAAIAPEAAAALARDGRRALDDVADLLERRRAEGFVRRCHGDLHLRNICLLDGRPTPFDAIEFDERIACIDVLYDLAFLLMDLDHRGERGLAGQVFNHYLQLTGDLGALPALPLFLACRAGIRAHVAAAMGAAGEARGYMDAAAAYLRPAPPRLVAVGGLSGSGKSRMGRDVAPYLGRAPGAVVVRSDVLRKRLCGLDMHTRLGPEGYGPEMTERTYEALYDEVAAVLRSGQSAVADAVFARPEQRDAIAAVARRLGVPFDGLWLEAAPEVMARRIESRGRNASDATVEVLARQLEYDLGDIAWRRFDTGVSKDESLRRVREALAA